MIHKDLSWAASFQGLYYLLGGPHPEKVRLTHSCADVAYDGAGQERMDY